MAMALLRETTLPRRLAQLDRDRLRRYRERLDFYNGLQWPGNTRLRCERRTVRIAHPRTTRPQRYYLPWARLSVRIYPHA